MVTPVAIMGTRNLQEAGAPTHQGSKDAKGVQAPESCGDFANKPKIFHSHLKTFLSFTFHGTSSSASASALPPPPSFHKLPLGTPSGRTRRPVGPTAVSTGLGMEWARGGDHFRWRLGPAFTLGSTLFRVQPSSDHSGSC